MQHRPDKKGSRATKCPSLIYATVQRLLTRTYAGPRKSMFVLIT